MILPPRLRPGAAVALVAPAGPISADRLQVALDRCRKLDLVPIPGMSVLARSRYLAGTDAQRLADLRNAIANPDVSAIWALRGGYGTMRLLGDVDLSPLLTRPLAYIGFSDNTAVHMALLRRGIVSFHGPHAGGDATGLSIRCFQRVLWNAEPAGVLELPAAPAPLTLVPGTAEGRLVGGNLSMLAALCGTPGQMDASGAILFLEDTGEPLYRIDRLWTQLALAGALDGVAGIAFGQFSDCDDDATVLLRSFAEERGIPALARLPIGHEPDNWTLPIGVRARLDADRGTLEILEPAVTP